MRFWEKIGYMCVGVSACFSCLFNFFSTNEKVTIETGIDKVQKGNEEAQRRQERKK